MIQPVLHPIKPVLMPNAPVVHMNTPVEYLNTNCHIQFIQFKTPQKQKPQPIKSGLPKTEKYNNFYSGRVNFKPLICLYLGDFTPPKAFMSINSSLQQMAGGFGAVLAGFVIVQKDNFSPLQHYDHLAMIASSIMLLTIYLMYRVSKIVEMK